MSFWSVHEKNVRHSGMRTMGTVPTLADVHREGPAVALIEQVAE